MVEVEFIFNGIKTTIQCNEEIKLKDLCNKYATKIRKNIDDIYFIYDGVIVKDNSNDLSFNQFAKKIDRERKRMNILVYDKALNKDNSNIIKSKEIKCNKCGGIIKLLIVIK